MTDKTNVGQADMVTVEGIYIITSKYIFQLEKGSLVSADMYSFHLQ